MPITGGVFDAEPDGPLSSLPPPLPLSCFDSSSSPGRSAAVRVRLSILPLRSTLSWTFSPTATSAMRRVSSVGPLTGLPLTVLTMSPTSRPAFSAGPPGVMSDT